ncbi:MAG: hypothetical protein US96_C0047G0002 [Candidatus Woesebacteria bacterium GW2011_GWB1_38_5b]|uniref:S23 ribosomal protein n=1 Tax=Candidatus Woesebacteria bacterium GW2011_GWB1_38_5b TaxID=1618569 RepID=A0A0G0N9W2_9BACT|nr:MAG: hypothetical protein US96_C0047G0002 [Candidatus Woesebacteria bacterium GW2011_GWB1_38_5b]
MVKMVKNFLKPEQINAYGVANELSDFIWNLVSKWNWFSKKTIGIQYVTAIDSIAGNIAEGFGRFHKKDKEKFYYNARGSLFESIHWTQKSKKRNLINQKDYTYIASELDKLPREINWLIKITEVKLKK